MYIHKIEDYCLNMETSRNNLSKKIPYDIESILDTEEVNNNIYNSDSSYNLSEFSSDLHVNMKINK